MMFKLLFVSTVLYCSVAQNPECDDRLGLDFNVQTIPDNAFSSSSQSAYGFRAARGRLNTYYDSTSDKKGGWMALSSDITPWIQVDLQGVKTITGVITQGRQCGGNWVTTFTVSYGMTDSSLFDFTNLNTDEPEVFKGNIDQNTEKTNYFPYEITARYLRIHPLTWNGAASLRFEVIGCATST